MSSLIFIFSDGSICPPEYALKEINLDKTKTIDTSQDKITAINVLRKRVGIQMNFCAMTILDEEKTLFNETFDPDHDPKLSVEQEFIKETIVGARIEV